jgi:hypothetical protein
LKNYFTIEHGYLKVTINQNFIAAIVERFSSKIRVIILLSTFLEYSPSTKPKEKPKE